MTYLVVVGGVVVDEVGVFVLEGDMSVDGLLIHLMDFVLALFVQLLEDLLLVDSQGLSLDLFENVRILWEHCFMQEFFA